jgi:glucose/arabinose dehydrogenase
MKRTASRFLVCGLVLLACNDGSGPGGSAGPYDLVDAFPNLAFARPTNIQNAGDGTNRLFLTEQLGRIVVFPNDASAASATEFLDLRTQVHAPVNSEMGLLGLAFHPDYENNGLFFVHYTTGDGLDLGARVSRFQVSVIDSNLADPGSERILLEFDDDYGNHNGGGLCFGNDGYLYIAIGDEGGGGDLNDNAQDRTEIFGKILRIDVDQNVDVIPYHGIPADNPYVGNGNGWREEIWAFGFRNPWRISFDAPTNRLFAGDVGQRTWEEIDIVEKGGNYGWDCREGRADYGEIEHSSSPLCAGATGLIDPIFVYGRSEGGSISGGYVYRGPGVPSLVGKYIYGDYISGRIWALSVAAGTSMLVRDTALFISTFGVAENNELFVAGYVGSGNPSSIYRIVDMEDQ